MVWMVKALWWIVSSLFESREQLETENLALRQLVNLLRRSAPRRLQLRNTDRLLFVWFWARLGNASS